MSTNTQLAVRGASSQIGIMELGEVFAKSGLFNGVNDQAKAVVKIVTGDELGIGPGAAMRGLHIMQGQVTLSAGLMAAMIKKSGKYTYRVKEHDGEHCMIVFFERNGDEWEEIGRENYTREDAQRARLWGKSGPWTTDPRSMLFNAAMRQGARRHCGDVFMGSVYEAEELADIPGPPGPQVVEATVEVVDETTTVQVTEQHYFNPDGTVESTVQDPVTAPNHPTLRERVDEFTSGLDEHQLSLLISSMKSAGIPDWKTLFADDSMISTATTIRESITGASSGTLDAEEDPRITPKQRARMFAIAKESGISNDEVREIIERITGDPSSTSITQELYDDVIAAIEAAPSEIPSLDAQIHELFDASVESDG
jgi:hypothetical protein